MKILISIPVSIDGKLKKNDKEWFKTLLHNGVVSEVDRAFSPDDARMSEVCRFRFEQATVKIKDEK